MSSYTSPPVGNNLSWIFWNFNPKFFSNPSKLEKILKEGLRQDKLTPLGWHTHIFNGGGYTMLVPLSESHLSLHSYKEYNSLCFGLYSCLGKTSGIKTYQHTLEQIKPKKYILIKHKMPIDLHYLNNLKIQIIKH